LPPRDYDTVTISGMIGSAYACVPDTGLWTGFLETVTTVFDVSGAQILCTDLAERKITFSALHGFDASLVDDFEAYAFDDPMLPHILDNPNKVFSDRRTNAVGNMLETRISREFLQPIGITERAGFLVTRGNMTFAFALLCGPGRDLLSNEELGIIALLQPHILQAVSLQQDLLSARYMNDSFVSLLDGLPGGIAFVDRDCRLHFANRVARDVLDAGAYLHLRRGEVRCRKPEDTADLRDAVRTAAGGLSEDAEADAPRTRVLMVDKGTSDDPVLVSVSPIGAGGPFDAGAFDPMPAVMVHICDPDMRLETSQDLLARLFGLVPSEARTLRALVAGKTIREIADGDGLSVETVRGYLKQIFNKTGCRRQSELIRLVASSPAWIRHRRRPD